MNECSGTRIVVITFCSGGVHHPMWLYGLGIAPNRLANVAFVWPPPTSSIIKSWLPEAGLLAEFVWATRNDRTSNEEASR